MHHVCHENKIYRLIESFRIGVIHINDDNILKRDISTVQESINFLNGYIPRWVHDIYTQTANRG